MRYCVKCFFFIFITVHCGAVYILFKIMLSSFSSIRFWYQILRCQLFWKYLLFSVVATLSWLMELIHKINIFVLSIWRSLRISLFFSWSANNYFVIISIFGGCVNYLVASLAFPLFFTQFFFLHHFKANKQKFLTIR